VLGDKLSNNTTELKIVVSKKQLGAIQRDLKIVDMSRIHGHLSLDELLF
jgi:hypothetical protein